MAFVVEDGTGLDNANSYSSVEDADTYFADRANAVWAALGTPAKQARLILATDYMDQLYGARYKSCALTETQALGFPREDFDGIPVKMKYACAEYALRAETPLAPDPVLDPAGVAMVTTKIKAGPVEQQFATAAGTSQAAAVQILRPYPGADMYMREFIRSGGGVYR